MFIKLDNYQESIKERKIKKSVIVFCFVLMMGMVLVVVIITVVLFGGDGTGVCDQELCTETENFLRFSLSQCMSDKCSSKR